MVLHKQGILSLSAGGRFFRYAECPRPRSKLAREFEAWGELRRAGLGPILQKSFDLRQLEKGLILEAEVLEPVSLERQMDATLPIIRALAKAARPTASEELPASVVAGLAAAKAVAGNRLPVEFADEDAIRTALLRPLLRGFSHRDLHYGNIMFDGHGLPILIDLKSCSGDRVLALDILTFVCKYLSARDGQNLIEQTFAVHRKGWRLAQFEPALSLVDIPRNLWGPAYFLHLLGLVSQKHAFRKPGGILRKKVVDVLGRNWQEIASARDAS